MSEFLTIGEPLVVFAAQEVDTKLADATHFQKFLAGAELNVAVGVSRLGHASQYVSQVGQDPFGEFIINAIQANNIATDNITTTPDAWTGYQLKEKVSSGDPNTFYFRKNSAAAQLTPVAIDNIDFTGLKHIHLSGIFPALSNNSRAAFQRLIDKAREQNITTTFDPNLRPALWASEAEMIATINDFAGQADIVMPGINEGQILLGSTDPNTIADFYLAKGAKLVIVKVGAEGAFAKTKTRSYFVPGFAVKQVVDTVGAGDGFAVGFITARLEGLSIEAALQRGNAIGALAVQHPGDNDGYPTAVELQRFLDQSTTLEVAE